MVSTIVSLTFPPMDGDTAVLTRSLWYVHEYDKLF
jgi:hypothetical protein